MISAETLLFNAPSSYKKYKKKREVAPVASLLRLQNVKKKGYVQIRTKGLRMTERERTRARARARERERERVGGRGRKKRGTDGASFNEHFQPPLVPPLNRRFTPGVLNRVLSQTLSKYRSIWR
jgi:hypothetical protein